MPDATHTPTQWWKSATGYQIYPRSFADSNGDGLGDIRGIIGKLDHLADLGIGFIWLSPVYRSPMKDNGYDISDYRDIAPEFGTLEDMDALIAAARARGIGIVMDLVVNHTSDQHDWFRQALADPSGPYRDFYIWRDPAPDGGPPSSMKAYFGGSAWERDPASGQYYLHLFTPEQPDLNWQNQALREAIWEMMTWWLDRGIAGFRMDVIDLIGKDVDAGIMEEGPYLHTFLREMHDRVLAGRDVVTIGETWNASTNTALLYSGREAGTLSMIFQFDHVKAGWDPVWEKWKPLPYDPLRLKAALFAWQEALADDGWNALFLGNHDLPRKVSTYGDGSAASAKALSTMLHLMKGTPFIYQGDEIGMTNASFPSLSDYRDVETLNMHEEMLARGMAEPDFLAAAGRSSRDNARTPMQWAPGPEGGFGTGAPWIGLPAQRDGISVAEQRDDPDSVLAHHRRLVALRKAHPVIVHGRFQAELREHPQIVAYTRSTGATKLVVMANLTPQPARAELSEGLTVMGETLIATHAPRAVLSGEVELGPFEAVAILSPGS